MIISFVMHNFIIANTENLKINGTRIVNVKMFDGETTSSCHVMYQG